MDNGNGFLIKGHSWQFGKRKTLKPEALPSKDEGLLVNEPLMVKLGIEHIEEPTPAIFDLSLKDRPGECWKSFPCYEGLYEISDQGRVKVLKKVSEGNCQKWYPEKIKHATLEVS